MSAPVSGKPDQNFKPSLALFDGTNPFAWEGSSILGAAFVQIVDNSGIPIVSFGGGTQYTDAGTPPAHPVGNTIEWNNSGTWATVGSAAPLPTSLYLGTTALLQAAHALNSTGGGIPTAQIVGEFDDTSPTSITENQFGNLRISANRNLYNTIRDAAGNERGANVTSANELNVLDSASSATGAAVPSKASYAGGQARSSEQSAATNANLTGFITDLVGKQIVLPYANPENFVSGRASVTDTTSTSLIAAPASGLRNYITQITVWNSSATSTYVKIQDGSGGTEIYDVPAPAGGGATLTLPTPLRQPTTATALFFAANAAANAIVISASGYKGS